MRRAVFRGRPGAENRRTLRQGREHGSGARPEAG